jgi:hypothetical protein
LVPVQPSQGSLVLPLAPIKNIDKTAYLGGSKLFKFSAPLLFLCHGLFSRRGGEQTGFMEKSNAANLPELGCPQTIEPGLQTARRGEKQLFELHMSF